jgi:O-antigen ligase
LILFAVKYLNRRRATYFLLLAAVVEFAVLLSSPYSRDRIEHTVRDYKVDRDTSVDRGTAPPAATSNGLRLAYWRVSIKSISEAPFFGHGTGSTQQLFSREAEGKSGEWGNIIRNPHNRRFTSRSNGACSVASSSMRCGTSICGCFLDPALHHGSAW